MNTRSVPRALVRPETGLVRRAARSMHDGSWTAKVVRRVRSAVAPDRFDLPELEFRWNKQPSHELIQDDICLSPFYGPQDHDDVTPLFALIQAMNPTVVIEFGTAQGNVTANICRQTSAQVITVNAPPEQLSGHVITFVLERDDIGRVYRRYGFANRVKQIYTNTLDVDLGEHLGPLRADVGIVDACHDREYVVNDFLKIAPFIREGGIVLLHDTHPGLGPPRNGSYAACRQLRQDGWDICHIRETWWGVWVRGGLRGSPVEKLLSFSRRLWLLG